MKAAGLGQVFVVGFDGSPVQPEKQAVNCELVTLANADQFGVFTGGSRRTKMAADPLP